MVVSVEQRSPPGYESTRTRVMGNIVSCCWRLPESIDGWNGHYALDGDMLGSAYVADRLIVRH